MSFVEVVLGFKVLMAITNTELISILVNFLPKLIIIGCYKPYNLLLYIAGFRYFVVIIVIFFIY